MFFSISASLQKSLNSVLFADFASCIKRKITIQLRRIYFDIFTKGGNLTSQVTGTS